MAEELPTGAATFHCPWCSATLPSADLETCPSCKATLTSISSGEAALPGVTAIDHEALLRTNREPRQPRSRILSWLSGEYVDDGEVPSQPDAIAPPDLAVRLEVAGPGRRAWLISATPSGAEWLARSRSRYSSAA